MAEDKLSFRRSRGLSPPSGLGGTHSLDSTTGLSSSRADPLKQTYEARKEGSFADHMDKVKRTYEKHSQTDVMEMIRAKMRSEGEVAEADRASFTTDYDEYTADALRRVRARRRKEEGDVGGGEGEEGAGSGSIF